MTYVRTFEDFRPPRRFDAIPFVSVEIKEAATADGVFTAIDSLFLSPTDTDPSEPLSRDLTTGNAQLDPAWYMLVWTDGNGGFFPSAPISSAPQGFAQISDVAARLGRELTDAEEGLADWVIGTLTGLIVDAVGRDSAWASALDPIPQTLRLLCVEKAVMAISNPGGLAAVSQTLGAESHSETYSRGAVAQAGIFLTDQERRNVFVALGLPLSASTRVRALPHEVDVTEPDEVA